MAKVYGSAAVAGAAAAPPTADRQTDHDTESDQADDDQAADQAEAARDPEAPAGFHHTTGPGRALDQDTGERGATDHHQVPPQTLGHDPIVCGPTTNRVSCTAPGAVKDRSRPASSVTAASSVADRGWSSSTVSVAVPRPRSIRQPPR